MLKLKELRESYGINQQQLAFRINVSRSTIAMWETGKATPNLDMLNTIADIFNVSVDYLLGRDSLPTSTTTALFFGKKLKTLRESFNLTQEDLGNKVQLSKPNISKYESGQIEPSIGTIIKFCEIFGVSADYLLDIQHSAVAPHLSKSDESLLNKYNQLNDLGKEKTNEYIDDLIASEKYTQDNKQEIIDFNDKVRTVGSDDELKAVAYGNGDISDDETVKHT